VILVGHVTKEGAVAGPKVLEHMVDVVVRIEGDRACRILRCEKNRHGSTEEIGLFTMGPKGFEEVAEPSRMFLEETTGSTPGSVICPVAEGNRVLPVEVQALVAKSCFAVPRRNAVGVDYNRVVRLCAVVEKHGGPNLSGSDVYVSVAGGLSVREPAVDLAIAAAMTSSHGGRPIGGDVAMVGEVGLAGEIRKVRDLPARLRALARLGVKRVFAPAGSVAATAPGIEVVPFANIENVFEALCGRGETARAAG
jgi:DNA repair protein RadA/Sms